MSDLRSVIQDHWDALSKQNKISHWQTSELPVMANGRRLLCAFGPEGGRHLLIPMARGESMSPDVRAAAVHLLTVTLESKGEVADYADLKLLRPDLGEIFTGLCADVMAGVATQPRNALTTVSQVLDDWRELLRSGHRLGVEQLAGLFGELSVLAELLTRRADAVEAWMGPLRRAQDFRLGPWAIEAKSTTSSEGRLIRIHGIDQLVVPEDGGLMLWWMRFDTASTEGTTVPELVEAVKRKVTRPRELWDRLARAGYYPSDANSYDGIRFMLRDQARYLVTDGFPRIVPSSFISGPPESVSDIRYTVDLAACPAPMSDHAVDEFLDTMVMR